VASTNASTSKFLPVLIGAGQGATLGPRTAAGITGVHPRDAGAQAHR
jgi:hypothetical protein